MVRSEDLARNPVGPLAPTELVWVGFRVGFRFGAGHGCDGEGRKRPDSAGCVESLTRILNDLYCKDRIQPGQTSITV